jgi:glycosyltransferase involved in cell wall biosynthesis
MSSDAPHASAGGAEGEFSICVGIATVGRASVLRQTLADIGRQTRLPQQIIVCHSTEADIAGILPDDGPKGVPLRFMASPAGLPRQRNAILDATSRFDAVLFIDDDFVMAPRYIEATQLLLAADAAVVATTGDLIHDDARGPGMTIAAGRALIDQDAAQRGDALNTAWRAAPHGYGCNMALRLATVRKHALRFDERLPLYGWSEDIDFTHRIARYGVIAKLAGARGVHLGVKQARSPGRRLGYSQVANPIYLLRKGSYSPGRAGRSVARNLAANCARAMWPEPYIDRRGRLAGNLLALADMCRGRMQPERILDI